MQAFASVAQSVEQLICNQRVGGSNPLAGSKNQDMIVPETARLFCLRMGRYQSLAKWGGL